MRIYFIWFLCRRRNCNWWLDCCIYRCRCSSRSCRSRRKRAAFENFNVLVCAGRQNHANQAYRMDYICLCCAKRCITYVLCATAVTRLPLNYEATFGVIQFEVTDVTNLAIIFWYLTGWLFGVKDASKIFHHVA